MDYDANAACTCGHVWYDHAGRFEPVERERIAKHRTIGCRVCGCGTFIDRDRPMSQVDVWEGMEFGNCFPFLADPSFHIDVGMTMFLLNDARQVKLPHPYVEIRGKVRHPWEVAWYQGPMTPQAVVKWTFPAPVTTLVCTWGVFKL